MRECMGIGLQRDPRRNFEPSIGSIEFMPVHAHLSRPARRASRAPPPPPPTTCSCWARTAARATQRRPVRQAHADEDAAPRAGARGRPPPSARRRRSARWSASSSGCATPRRSRPRTTPLRRARLRGRQAPRPPLSGVRETRCARCSPTVEGIAARRQLTPSRLHAAVADLAAQPRVVDAPGRCWHPAGGSSSRAPSWSGSTTPARACSSRCSATSASSTGSGARRENDAAGRHARRAAAARRRARGRARVGVLLRVRRRPAAVGERARAGHRRAGAGAQRPPGCSARPTCCRSPSARWRSSRPRRRRACACRPTHGGHYAIYSFAPRPAGAQRLHPVADRALRLRAPLRRPARRRAVRGGRAGGARRGADLRHRRLVAVLARQLDARVRPRLPRPADRLPRGPVRPHRPPRSTARRPRTSSRTSRSRRWSWSSRGACAAASRGAWRSSSRRSPASALRITRGTKVVEERPFGVVGYGRRTFGWDVPRRRGDYTVELAVRDLVGNPASASAVVTVLKPKRQKRP